MFRHTSYLDIPQRYLFPGPGRPSNARSSPATATRGLVPPTTDNERQWNWSSQVASERRQKALEEENNRKRKDKAANKQKAVLEQRAAKKALKEAKVET